MACGERIDRKIAVIKILAITTHKLLTDNFGLLSKAFIRPLDIVTLPINFRVPFDPTLELAIEPDLVMLPIGLSGLDGFALIRAIRAVNAEVPILITCNCYARADLEELLKYNIQGIRTTNATPEELIAAIYDVVDKKPGTIQKHYQHAL